MDEAASKWQFTVRVAGFPHPAIFNVGSRNEASRWSGDLEAAVKRSAIIRLRMDGYTDWHIPGQHIQGWNCMEYAPRLDEQDKVEPANDHE
jgi:hypothetical protein